MRYLLVCCAVISAVLATGCTERQNMNVVPNRELRAGGDQSSKVGDNAFRPIATPNEAYYTMEAKDDVYTVAKKFNVTTKWLIKRNEIHDETMLKPGTNLIVPRK